MAAVKRKVLPARFYRTATGAEPVRKWLKALSREDKRIVGTDIATVEFGWPVGMPTCRPLASRRGLLEVRSSLTQSRIARVLFCIHQGQVVLLHGFIKKTQQTPENDLDLAVKRQKRLKVAKRRNKHVGSSFDEFLRTEGLYEEVTTLAWKRVLSWEVSEAMRKGHISKSEMAKRMGTSRSQLERLLDPENPHVLLETVQKAATAVGKRLTIGLTDAPRAA